MPSGSEDGVRAEVVSRRILPVVVLHRVADALPLCAALAEGGLPVAEVTFRTDAAEASIREIARAMPEILLGAGTVLTPEQVDRAADAGARFIVTPGFSPRTVEAAERRGIPIVPGVNGPTEVEMALSYGLTLLKFFPAEASGGRAMLRALAGPYGDVRFVPTGGIGPENLADYLALANVAACGGSWMVATDLVADGRFDEIAARTRQAVNLAQPAG